jgi:hypothetical protein
VTPRRILVAGWLVFLLYAYPGYMRSDAVDQLFDARTGEFTDWHSTMMTELWRIVDIAISGPAGMVFVQSLLLLAGTYHLARRTMSDRTAAAVAVVVLLAPPLVVTTALVCAEALLASMLVAAAAALASDRAGVRWLGLGLIALACALNDAAIPAALPIVIAAFRPGDVRGWRRVAIAMVAWAAAAAAAIGANGALVDVVSQREEVALAMSDIAGTIYYAPPASDAELAALVGDAPIVSTLDIQGRASALYADRLRTMSADDIAAAADASSYAIGKRRIFDPPVTAAERDAIFAARRAVVRAWPAAYLEHRWHQFRGVLGLTSAPWWPVQTSFTPGPRERWTLQFTASHSFMQRTLIRPVHWLSNHAALLFRAHFYLLLAIALVPIAVVRRHREAIVLLASGIAYELALFFVANRIEYRDSHWLAVATWLAIALLVGRARSKLRNERLDDEAAIAVARDDRDDARRGRPNV